MEPTKKYIVFQDDRLVNHTQEKFKELEPDLIKLLELARELNISIDSPDELHKAIFEPEKFVNSKQAEKITDDQVPEYAGVKLKKTEFVRMLDFPDPGKFIELAKDLSQRGPGEILEIVKVGSHLVSIDQAKWKSFVENHSLIAESKDEIELWEKLESFRKAFVELRKFAKAQEKKADCRLQLHNLAGAMPIGYLLEFRDTGEDYEPKYFNVSSFYQFLSTPKEKK